MKKHKQLPYWYNWIAALVVLIILIAVFWGEIVFVLFSEVTEDNYGNQQHEAVQSRMFTSTGMIWQMLMHSGISLVAGFIVRGWVGVTITDVTEEKEE